jgi:HK97 family phage major capsid protein
MDQTELLNKMTGEVKCYIDSFKSELKNATKQDIENAISAIEVKVKDLNVDTLNASLKELKEAAKAQGEYLATFEAKKDSKTIDFAEFLEIKKEELKNVGKNNTLELTFKTTAETSIVTSSTLNDRMTKISMPDINTTLMESLIPAYNLGENNGGVRRYIDMTAYTSNAAYKAEKASMPEDAATFQEYSISVKKVGTTIPITEEFLYDYKLLSSEIKNRLIEELKLKIDDKLLNGTGADVSGIYGAYAQSYAVGSFANTIINPSIYDLILVLKAQMSAGKAKYMPNYVIMNPVDVITMMSTKNDLGDYVKPTFVSNDYMVVGGVTIKQSNLQTANTLTIGDFRYSELIKAGDINLQIGYNLSEDFSKGILTVRAVKRFNALVRHVDQTGFTKVTSISDALTGLKKV